MSSLRRRAIGALAILLTIVPAARAQQPVPRVGYVYPAGGRQGAALQVTVGGQFLDGVSHAFVSGAGVEAKVVEHVKPITQQQFNQLRERLEELQKKGRDAATVKEIAEIRQKLATFIRRPANPAIAETVTLQLTLAEDAEPGQRELRLETPVGLTNPLVFCVGQLPEFSKTTAKSGPAGMGKGFRYRNEPQGGAAAAPMTVTLPATVNGQIMPGGVDRFRFQARKGERLVVAASARELIPYLPDAVPGWFQAALAIHDAKGNELAYADHYRFHPDPVLCLSIPEDGQYTIEIRDSIYRGREDFVYRIAVGELPFVTGIFPLGGKAGAETAVELKGWNLPCAALSQDSRGKGPGIYPLFVRQGQWISNRVPFSLDALPECREQEPNDSRQSAQSVKLPVIVNGRIDKPGDSDVFRFDGRAGDQIVAEVHARRLGSPLDSVLALTDPAGRQLALNDDHEDRGAGLDTHHADSRLQVTLPADGAYCVRLGDAQRKGGEEYAYRLRIGAPQPDFQLRVVPSSVTARGGVSAPVTVYALRKDGFAGEIAVRLKDPPAGFALSGGWVPAGQDKVRLTLTVAPAAANETVSLCLEGRAMVEGQEVVRPAVPAEDMMQAFAYRHLVPCQELKVAVSGRRMPRNAVNIVGTMPVKIAAGGTGRVRLTVPADALRARFHLDLDEPPDGISIREIVPVREGTEIVFQGDAAKAKPGLKGNLIVQAFAAKFQPSEAGKPQGKRARVPLWTLPAIPFEIVGQP